MVESQHSNCFRPIRGFPQSNLTIRERFSWPVVLLLFFFSGLFVLSCGPRETAVEKANEAGILLLGNGTEPSNLDPHVVSGIPAVKIIQALLEGLVTYDDQDDSIIQPAAASSWNTSADGLIWTFHLRSNGKWSNGDPVTAGDFVYSWKRSLQPALGCEYADWFFIIENAEPYFRGEISDFSQVGIEALDDQTLEVRLRAPTPTFLYLLLNHSFFPVHPATIEKYGAIDTRNSKWTQPGHYVGNGPFVLKSWTVNQQIEVEKNPLYWNVESMALNGIRFFAIENIETEERAFAAGQLHYCSTVSSSRLDYYRKEAPGVIHFDDYLGIYHYRLNVTRGPMQDSRVRRAFSLATDRQRLVDLILRGDQKPALAYTPPRIPGYNPPELVRFDPEKARALLAEAGYPGGQNFPKLELLYNTSENHRILAEAIQQMWEKNLNVKITLANQEWKVFLNTQRNLDYDIARSGWIGSLYPLSFLVNFHSESGNNDTGWSHPEYDSLIDQARLTGGLEERYRLYEKAEAIMLTESPVIPLFWYTRIYLLDPSVDGWHPKLSDMRPYQNVRLRK